MALIDQQRRSRLSTVFAASVAAALTWVALAWSSPAFANSTVKINDSGHGVTAKQATQGCDANFGGGPFDGFDVWVFNLPGQHGTAGDFVSVIAQFDTDGDNVPDTTKTIVADQPSAIVLDGTSKAWIKLPAGWVLEDASAVITGNADFFVLTHACAATSGSPSPLPPSASVSSIPSSSASESPSTSGSPSSSTSASTLPSGSSSPSVPSSPSLPVTGSSLTFVVIAGIVLVGGGAGLVVLARRRRITG